MDDNTASEAGSLQPNRPGFNPDESIPPEEMERLTDAIIAALKSVYDPEIPADIYELGLIYLVEVDASRFVNIDMTLTAPAARWQVKCPNGLRMRWLVSPALLGSR